MVIFIVGNVKEIIKYLKKTTNKAMIEMECGFENCKKEATERCEPPLCKKHYDKIFKKPKIDKIPNELRDNGNY